MSSTIQNGETTFYYNRFYDIMASDVEMLKRMPMIKQAVIACDLSISNKMDLTKILDAIDSSIGVKE